MNESLKNEAQKRALEAAISQITKAFGKDSIRRIGDKKIDNIEVISTGSLALDCSLGIKGFPLGRVVEISGAESSGKTTLALHVLAQTAKAGGSCAFIDAEHALDLKYAKKIGVDVNNLYVSQPDNGEQALEILDKLVASSAFKCIVVDSVAALVPRSEIEGEMGDSHMGLQARLMSQALRKLTGSISKTNCLVIFINQVRQKIGISFGDSETTTGGLALKFYSSIRIKVQPLAMIKKNDLVVGREIAFKIIKNKCYAPGAQARSVIRYGLGISRVDELFEYGVTFGIIKKAGSWCSYVENGVEKKIGQGKDSALEFLRQPQNASLCELITKKAYENIGSLDLDKEVELDLESELIKEDDKK